MRFFTAALMALSVASVGLTSSVSFACDCAKEKDGKACACDSAKDKAKKCACGAEGEHKHDDKTDSKKK